jgi:hypothetical protein
MKLSDLRKDNDYYSGKASELARQLAFAGIAVIWVFKRGAEGQQGIPAELVRPALFFWAALGFDFAQYLAATFIWDRVYRYHEKKLKKISDDPAVGWPPYFTWPQLAFFFLKIAAVAVGYALLMSFLAMQWKIFPA